jgi:hypothetical protein
MPHTAPAVDQHRVARGRWSRILAVGTVAGALGAGGLFAPVVSAATPAQAAAARRPGLIGSPVAIAQQAQFSGYDIGINGAGKAYVGWISASAGAALIRTVHLCTIPAGKLTCAGGVRSTPSLDAAGAEGLRVLVAKSGKVTLVWFHDTMPGSIDGPRGGRIAESTVLPSGALSPAVDVGDAPSFGAMQDAEIGPDQKIWTVSSGSSGASPLEVRDGAGATAVKVRVPFAYTGQAKLSFTGRTPVLVAAQAGAVTKPLFAASRPGSAWTAFRPVGGTWSVGTSFGMTTTAKGARLVASTSNASYAPVVATFGRTGFSKPTLLGDTNSCAPSSHDPVTDSSGRLADISIECSQIAVADLYKKAHAGIVRFAARGTTAAGIPQIATTAGGRAIVAWTIETSNPTNPDRLYIGAVRLAPGVK